jgi:hypothetical protein
MWRDSMSGPPLVAAADPNFRSCLSARASCIASSMFLAIWSHAIKTLTSRLVRQDLYLKTWGEEGFHEKSPTRVCDERPPGTRGFLVLCHLFGQSRVQSILELIDTRGGLRLDAKITSAHWIRAISSRMMFVTLRYAAAGGPNQVASASERPVSVRSPTQATYPSGLITRQREQEPRQRPEAPTYRHIQRRSAGPDQPMD